MSALGIDVSGSLWRAAVASVDGVPQLMPDLQVTNQFATPARVFLAGGEALVGQPAVGVEGMGEGGAVVEVLEPMAHLTTERIPEVDARGRPWPGVALAAILLRKLLRDVLARNQETPRALVLAIPETMTSEERRALRVASRLAGLPEPVLTEHAVAATTYLGPFPDAGETKRSLVLRLGFTACASSLVETSVDTVRVRQHTATQDGLGRVTREVRRHLESGASSLHGPSVLRDVVSRFRVRRLAEVATREVLGGATKVFRRMVLLGGQPFEFVLPRSLVQRYVAPLLDELMERTSGILYEAETSWRDLEQVLLVGDGTSVDGVVDHLRERSRLPAERIVQRQPEAAVAFGASLIAQTHKARGLEAEAVDAVSLPFDVGLSVWDAKAEKPSMRVLAAQGARLPVEHTTSVYTTRDGQPRILIEVVRRTGEEKEPVRLGLLDVGPLERARKNQRVDVTVHCEVDGRIRVVGRDSRSGLTVEEELVGDVNEEAALLSTWGEVVESLAINP